MAVFFVFVAAPLQPGASVWAQSNPAPLINQPLVPDAAAPGGPQFTLTVNGTGFVSGSVVQWNGSALATTFVSSAQLSATVPASAIGTPGTASVTVANPGRGEISAPQPFEVTTPALGIGLGQYNITFDTEANYWVITADLNRDGKLDLVVSYASTGYRRASDLYVMLGNGDGTFQAPVGYPVPWTGIAVAAQDLNGDGRPDLIALTGQGLAIMLGNGDGTFRPPLYSNGGIYLYDVAIGDFNGDGKVDLALTTYPDQVLILIGNGVGTFQAPVSYNAGNRVLSLTTGDFNQDGKLDLAVAAEDDNAVAILLGNGDGSFQSPVEYATAGLSIVPVTADLNGDGKLDLAVAAVDRVSVLLGNGDGTFQTHVDYPSGINPVTVADVNGDGKPDLATLLSGTEMQVLLGNGDGTFQRPAPFPFTQLVAANSAAIGDFNGDGRPDFATADEFGNASVFLQVPSVVWPTLLDFGLVKVGSGGAFGVTVANTGQAPFTVTGLTLTDKAEFGELDNCLNQVVLPGSSCKIRVAFNPTGTGSFTATLTVSDTADNVPQTVSIEGRGAQ